MVLFCMFVKVLQPYTFYLSSLLMALSCDDISGLLSSSHSAKSLLFEALRLSYWAV